MSESNFEACDSHLEHARLKEVICVTVELMTWVCEFVRYRDDNKGHFSRLSVHHVGSAYDCCEGYGIGSTSGTADCTFFLSVNLAFAFPMLVIYDSSL